MFLFPPKSNYYSLLPVIPVLVLGIGAIEVSLLLEICIWFEFEASLAVVTTLLLWSERFSPSDDDESPESIEKFEQI